MNLAATPNSLVLSEAMGGGLSIEEVSARVGARKYLVSPLLVLGEVTSLVGDDIGIRNSMISLIVACACAAGRDPFPGFELMPNDGGDAGSRKVLFVATDQDPTELDRRVSAICRAYGFDPAVVGKQLVYGTTSFEDGGIDAFMSAVSDALGRARCELLVIDSVVGEEFDRLSPFLTSLPNAASSAFLVVQRSVPGKPLYSDATRLAFAPRPMLQAEYQKGLPTADGQFRARTGVGSSRVPLADVFSLSAAGVRTDQAKEWTFAILGVDVGIKDLRGRSQPVAVPVPAVKRGMDLISDIRNWRYLNQAVAMAAEAENSLRPFGAGRVHGFVSAMEKQLRLPRAEAEEAFALMKAEGYVIIFRDYQKRMKVGVPRT